VVKYCRKFDHIKRTAARFNKLTSIIHYLFIPLSCPKNIPSN
jgi:hypothetical protein